MYKTICPICEKPITASQSFSCAVCGEDKDGKIEVEKTHSHCRFKVGLTDYQKKNFYEQDNTNN